MSARSRIAILGGPLLLLALAGCGGDETGPSLQISGAVVRVPAGTTAAAYFTIDNTGSETDRLLGVTSSAGMAEMHETIVQDGVASMRPVEGGVEVPASGRVAFEPGGLHIMLLDVPPLVEGDTITLTLEWQRSDIMTVEAPVLPMVGDSGMDPG